ncbi:hypothetical protein Fmac_012597 [Flemingia macrophylla]|uniref:Phytocyanin domain-containing protein n=1 Tax=Flemingia macrophylla TaxID=520843 RepID=A0ABD1MQR7_9FABA
MKRMSGLGGVLAILMLLHYAEAQSEHVVGGDSLGWSVPPDNSTYQNWAFNRTFRVGDTLVFNFESGHDVREVSEDSYDDCNVADAIGSPGSTSPTNVVLDRVGDHYYICGFGRHCLSGQKLAITVSGNSTNFPPSPPPNSASTSLPTFIRFLFFSALLILVF